jgi:hypothetical protein
MRDLVERSMHFGYGFADGKTAERDAVERQSGDLVEV